MKKSLLLLLTCLFSAILMAETRPIAKPSFGPAFNVEITPLPDQKEFRGFAIRFPSAFTTPDYPINNTVLGEIYLPLNAKPDHQTPAVQVFHTIGPDKFQLERKVCQVLAKEGIAGIYIQLPYFGQRGGLLGPIVIIRTEEAFFQGLEQTRADAIRANDILLSFPEINPQKLGAMGFSLGAFMTANAAAIDHRIQRALMILGGGNLQEVFATNTNETKDLLAFFSREDKQQQEELYRKIAKYDPINCVDRLKVLARNGKCAMINAQNDNVIPPKCSKLLAEKIGCPIKWYPNVNHYTFFEHLSEAGADIRAFFKQDLPKPATQPKN